MRASGMPFSDCARILEIFKARKITIETLNMSGELGIKLLVKGSYTTNDLSEIENNYKRIINQIIQDLGEEWKWPRKVEFGNVLSNGQITSFELFFIN